jgi:hypothetical protein
MTGCPLSSELKVACEIYHFNKAGEPVHFGKLVDRLKGVMSKQKISEVQVMGERVIFLRLTGTKRKKLENYMKNTGR